MTGMNQSDTHPQGDDSHIAAHRYSSRHREQIECSERCGCFHCLHIFAPADIEDWWDEPGHGTTAVCPRCGIDAVIGSASGFPITPQFLQRMKSHWFE